MYKVGVVCNLYEFCHFSLFCLFYSTFTSVHLKSILLERFIFYGVFFVTQENIEAKRENYGNFDSMVLLLDCLKRRENWPEQFIQALEECEHSSVAAEIRAEYDALRGVDSESTYFTFVHICCSYLLFRRNQLGFLFTTSMFY